MSERNCIPGVELKPCPFCDGKAVLKAVRHVPNGYEYTPMCTVKSCAGRLAKKWLHKQDAIEAWNRRGTNAEH